MDPSSQNFIELRCSDETTSRSRTFHIDSDKIENLVQAICHGLGVDTYEVSWNFVDDEEMRELNQQYRDKDKSTDVLSFPQQEFPKPLNWGPSHSTKRAAPKIPQSLGDIVISPNVALDNATHIGHNLDREVCFLIVHGILHLCGHDHMNPAEEEVMTKEQQTIMNYLESSEGSPLWTDCARVGD